MKNMLFVYGGTYEHVYSTMRMGVDVGRPHAYANIM